MHISIVMKVAFYPTRQEVVETLQRKVTEEQFNPIPIKHWFETIRLPLLSSNSKAHQVLGVCTDISEARKQRELEL